MTAVAYRPVRPKKFRRPAPKHLIAVAFFLIVFYYYARSSKQAPSFTTSRTQIRPVPSAPFSRPTITSDAFQWGARLEKYPLSSMTPLPTDKPAVKVPEVQYKFKEESQEDVEKREKRRHSVKVAFARAWNSYRSHAWKEDELTPLTGSSRTTFGGWAATLIDTLDTLWIMDMREEFAEAVGAVKEIDFTTTNADEVNIFETTVRYVGGLLSAYDLSGGQYPILLEKAVELGDMLYAAFDTPNRMPITRWKWKKCAHINPLFETLLIF